MILLIHATGTILVLRSGAYVTVHTAPMAAFMMQYLESQVPGTQHRNVLSKICKSLPDELVSYVPILQTSLRWFLQLYLDLRLPRLAFYLDPQPAMISSPARVPPGLLRVLWYESTRSQVPCTSTGKKYQHQVRGCIM